MANIFNTMKAGLFNTIDTDVDTLDILLLTTCPASLTAALRDLATVTAVLADAAFVEATDASYTANGTTGRVALGAATVSRDDANDRGEADFPDITYTALDSFTIAGAVVYKRVGASGPSGDGTHLPLGLYVFTKVCNGGNIVLQPDAEGLFQITE